MASRLCVTVAADSMAELRTRRDRAGGDLVELRLDTVRDPSASGALAGRAGPVIVSCRPTWEGGHFTGSEDERRRLLGEAMRLGADYVDVEWRADFPELLAARNGRGVVLSSHDFDGVPADLEARASAMRATGAEVVKVAATVRRLDDTLPLLALGRGSSAPTVVIGMGDAGLASRILAERFGSCWTYAGEGIAPGQIAARRMEEDYGFHHIGVRTKVYGVVGRAVMHSLSPAIHNAAFRATGIDAVYLPLAAADFDDFLAFADALGVEGASVTAPFKVEAFARAAVADEASRRIRAANTMRRAGRGWVACNTDLDGFLEPLRARVDLAGLRAVVLGGGGAARAAADALVRSGSCVAIAARRRSQADAVAAVTASVATDWPPSPGSWDLLVNATPVGTVPHVADSPVPNLPLTGRLVYDLVYNPPETRLLADARTAGCQTLGGLEMLVAQAAGQFTWWTGRPAPIAEMRAAAARALAPAGDRQHPVSPTR